MRYGVKDIKICNNCNCNGTSRNNDIIRVQDALIEEINIRNRTGYVTISYGVLGEFSMIHMELVTLIVSHDTIIQNQFGQKLSLRDLREGMVIDAEFSSAMTRSIPPQSRAFRITVLNTEGSFKVRVDSVLFLLSGHVLNLLS
jgi:hypothetical protein